MRRAVREQVLVRLRPHGRALVLPLLVLLGALALAGYAAASVPAGRWQGPGRATVAGVTVLVLLRWSVRPWLRWLSAVVVVTERRVRWQSGLLRRRTSDVPLSRVAGVTVDRSLGQRLVGSGTLVLHAVNGTATVLVRDVGAPHEVADEIEELLAGAPLDDD